MRRRHTNPARRRSGKILVMSALVLPVLLGSTGLVIDCSMLMAAHRQAQNAADAAVMAAAMDKLRGSPYADAFATAEKFVKDPQYNNLTTATLDIHLDPTSGAYADDPNAIEAIVTSPIEDSANTARLSKVFSKRTSDSAPVSAPTPSMSRKKSPERTSAAISTIPPMSQISAAMTLCSHSVHTL